MDLPPYLIEVNQFNIEEIILCLKSNNLLHLIKVTTVLGDDCDIEEILNIKNLVKCSKIRCHVLTTKKCGVCNDTYCEDHLHRCRSCSNYTCDKHITISFDIDTHSEQEICENCD